MLSDQAHEVFVIAILVAISQVNWIASYYPNGKE